MITIKRCSDCGASFECGATGAIGTCWCSALPNIVPISGNGDCLCPACLKARIKEIETAKSVSTLHDPQ